MKELLEASSKFRSWMGKLTYNGLSVGKIKELYTFHLKDHVLFSLVHVEAETDSGEKLPPICFVKGSAASILICLKAQETGERFLLLVKQRRIAHGGISYEHVAGMVDQDDDPREVALREAQEESGLELTIAQILPLWQGDIYPSPGASDERIFLFYTELEMPKAEIMAKHGERHGLQSEHEVIHTHVVPMDEAEQLIDNTNGLLSIYLYKALLATQA